MMIVPLKNASRKLEYTLVLAGFAILFGSCQKQPTACFKANKTTEDVGDDVFFTNCSTDADHYEWDFGDGSNSSETSVWHSWATAGAYTVTLTAFSKNGKKTAAESKAVTIES